jgi:hypothetical protein
MAGMRGARCREADGLSIYAGLAALVVALVAFAVRCSLWKVMVDRVIDQTTPGPVGPVFFCAPRPERMPAHLCGVAASPIMARRQ